MSTENTNQTGTVSTILDETVQRNVALSRFDSTFMLESETIGKSIRKTVSKTGAVRVDAMSKKELEALTGLKGGDLLVHMRKVTDGLKSEMAAGFARMAANAEWTGRSITLNKKGDTLTFSLKKVGRPVAIEQKMTLTDAAKLMGIPQGREQEAVKALVDLGIIDQPAEKQEEQPEGEAAPDTSNGEVRKGAPEDGLNEEEKAGE